MELNINNGKTLSVSDAVFGREFSEDLVHQVVVAYRNAGRAGPGPAPVASSVATATPPAALRGALCEDRYSSDSPLTAIGACATHDPALLRAVRAVATERHHHALAPDPLHGAGRRHGGDAVVVPTGLVPRPGPG